MTVSALSLSRARLAESRSMRGRDLSIAVTWAPAAASAAGLPPKEGYLFLDKAKFAASFASDVDPDAAAFMADSQVPWGIEALGGAITEPAWKSKPSWYLQVRDDPMIPYPAQQFMAKRAGATVVEVPGPTLSMFPTPRPSPP